MPEHEPASDAPRSRSRCWIGARDSRSAGVDPALRRPRSTDGASAGCGTGCGSRDRHDHASVRTITAPSPAAAAIDDGRGRRSTPASATGREVDGHRRLPTLITCRIRRADPTAKRRPQHSIRRRPRRPCTRPPRSVGSIDGQPFVLGVGRRDRADDARRPARFSGTDVNGYGSFVQRHVHLRLTASGTPPLQPSARPDSADRPRAPLTGPLPAS